MLGAVAVLAALVGRERTGSPIAGDGQRIDVSLLGSTLASLVNQAQNAFVTGVAPGPARQRPPEHRPVRDVRDRRRRDRGRGRLGAAVAAAVRGDRAAGAGRRSALRDATATASSGGRRSARCSPRVFATRSTADWLAALDAADIPCGPINDVLAAFASPEAEALGMTVELEHPAWGVIRQVGVPFQLSATPASIRTAPPLLGEHTDEVLAELGYDAAEVAQLRRSAIV